MKKLLGLVAIVLGIGGYIQASQTIEVRFHGGEQGNYDRSLLTQMLLFEHLEDDLGQFETEDIFPLDDFERTQTVVFNGQNFNYSITITRELFDQLLTLMPAARDSVVAAVPQNIVDDIPLLIRLFVVSNFLMDHTHPTTQQLARSILTKINVMDLSSQVAQHIEERNLLDQLLTYTVITELELAWIELFKNLYKRHGNNLTINHVRAYFGLEEFVPQHVDDSDSDSDNSEQSDEDDGEPFMLLVATDTNIDQYSPFAQVERTVHPFRPRNVFSVNLPNKLTGQQIPDMVSLLFKRSGVNINKEYANKITPLMLAVSDNNVVLTTVLLQYATIAVNQKDISGRTALMIAADSSAGYVVPVLLNDPRVDRTIKDRHGRTAFLLAALQESVIDDFLPFMTTRDLNARSTFGMTALMFAIHALYPDNVRFLLTRPDLEVNAQNAQGKTACMVALDVFGNNPDDNATALEMIRMFVADQRFDLTIRDYQGRTLLMQAVQAGLNEVVQLLLASGRSGLAIQNADGKTAWMLALEGGRLDEETQIVFINTILRDANFDFFAQDNNGKTVLMIFAENNNHILVDGILNVMDAQSPYHKEQLLLLADKQGKTAYDYAVAKGHSAMATKLAPTLFIPKEACEQAPKRRRVDDQ